MRVCWKWQADTDTCNQDDRDTSKGHFGLPSVIVQKLSKSAQFVLPHHIQMLVEDLLSSDIPFKGITLLNFQDLKELSGRGAKSSDNWLSNFVIDEYLSLISSQAASNVKTVPWEKFDTYSDEKIAEELEGNGSFNEHNLIILPCNPGRSHHWFLIAVLPKLNLVVALDSAASSHVKPSVNITMDKCMRVLSLLPNPGKEWMYYCNTAEDVLQQGNAFDCGVFLCIYARALSLGDPLIVPDSLPDA